MRQRHERGQSNGLRGFTLIEQILTTMIIAVLACMAAPALGHLVRRNRLQTAQSDIIAALQQVRSLALHTRQRAMLCPTRDGEHCSDELHWENGWLLGHYRSDRADQLDDAPALVASVHDQITILSTTGRRRIRFQADGTAHGSNASFTLCRTGLAEEALAVTVANSGRVFGAKASPEQANRCANGG